MNLKLITTAGLMLLTQLSWAQGSDESYEKAFGIPAGHSVAQQQPAITYRQSLNIAPLTALFGGIRGKYERFLTTSTSINLSGTYIADKELLKGTDSLGSYAYTYSYKEIALGSTYMLSGNLSSDGAYLEPSLGMMTTEVSEVTTNISASLTTPYAKAMVGYQWINSTQPIRFALAGGLSVYNAEDIIVKNSKGEEDFRTKNSNMSAAAIDIHFGYMF